MSNAPIEGGEDRYAEGTPYHSEYLEGREAMMEGLELHENPYIHQPHDANKRAAWEAGWRDEDTWRLDSTGR